MAKAYFLRKSYASDGQNGLVVRLKRRPGKDDLWQLPALCRRYDVDMRQLAKFERRRIETGFAIPGSIGTGRLGTGRFRRSSFPDAARNEVTRC
jgi:hypothetical protein